MATPPKRHAAHRMSWVRRVLLGRPNAVSPDPGANQTVLTPAPAPDSWPHPDVPHPSTSDPRPAVSGGGAWVTDRERSGTRAVKTAGRVVLWVAATAVMAAGLRQIVFPPAHPAPMGSPALGSAWPAGAATAAERVASRFAVDYLTWDEDNPTTRSQALDADLPSGVDMAAGWDGHGRQTVTLAIAGGVHPRSRTRGVVTVQARVIPYTHIGGTGAAAGWQALPQAWRTLAVPVAITSGRVVVTGAPAYVGEPTPPRVPPEDPPAIDSAISAQTRSQAEAFFAAYAGGDTTAYTAPGAQVAGLGGQVSFVGLDSWSVHTGTPDRRDASAAVRWRDVTGAVLTQSYQVRLVRIATTGGSRWFVDRVQVGTGNGGR